VKAVLARAKQKKSVPRFIVYLFPPRERAHALFSRAVNAGLCANQLKKNYCQFGQLDCIWVKTDLFSP
jgi:hypothetical protein